MMHRAHSTLETKSIDEQQRILYGLATSPEPDRLGDRVISRGARFKLPLPFLYQHDSDKPIGHVTQAAVSDDGIDIEVKLAKTDVPGPLKDRLDTAWQEIQLGLIRGLSIGFRSIKDEPIEEQRFARKYLEWEWLELSAVTIPAHRDASIHVIRALDQASLAALGTRDNSPPTIIDHERAERRRRAGLPNSQVGHTGLRHSVRIIG
jgi:HK97 family phage prohead protease